MAFFCTKTGARISAPGVSKSVDPVNGHEEVSEAAPTADREELSDVTEQAGKSAKKK